MDPDSRRRLDRALRRQRLKTVALVAVVLCPFAALASLAWLPPRPDGVVQSAIVGVTTLTGDDVTPVRRLVRLPDGSLIRLRPRPGDAARAPGRITDGDGRHLELALAAGCRIV